MLRVSNTNNLMGIVIHGDYDDLDTLRDALARVNEFCFEERKKLYEEMNPDAQDQKYEAVLYQEYEYFLSLNYDIRHAFQGDRNYELRDNRADRLDDKKTYFDEESETYRKYERLYEITKHGNLQFSVEILYPMALYYMFVINDYIFNMGSDDLYESMTIKYTQQFASYDGQPYTLYQDLGILLQFYGLLQQAIAEAIGTARFNHLLAYMNESFHSNKSTLYPEALFCYFFNAAPRMTKTARKALITAMAYELYDSAMFIGVRGFAQASKDYNDALKKVNAQSERQFPNADGFNAKLNDLVSQNSGMLYNDVFDQFLNKEYGSISDDYSVFGTSPWPDMPV